MNAYWNYLRESTHCRATFLKRGPKRTNSWRASSTTRLNAFSTRPTRTKRSSVSLKNTSWRFSRPSATKLKHVKIWLHRRNASCAQSRRGLLAFWSKRSRPAFPTRRNSSMKSKTRISTRSRTKSPRRTRNSNLTWIQSSTTSRWNSPK